MSADGTRRRAPPATGRCSRPRGRSRGPAPPLRSKAEALDVPFGDRALARLRRGRVGIGHRLPRDEVAEDSALRRADRRDERLRVRARSALERQYLGVGRVRNREQGLVDEPAVAGLAGRDHGHVDPERLRDRWRADGRERTGVRLVGDLSNRRGEEACGRGEIEPFARVARPGVERRGPRRRRLMAARVGARAREDASLDVRAEVNRGRARRRVGRCGFRHEEDRRWRGERRAVDGHEAVGGPSVG